MELERDLAPALPPSDEAGREGARRRELSRVGAALCKGRRRWWPSPDDDEHNEFPMDQESLVRSLSTDDPELAAAILAEAEEIADLMVDERVESVERRAATLQGVVAIAGSFSLAGGTFLITQVQGTGWRTVLGGLLLFIVASFGLCGLRATQAAAAIQRWTAPPKLRILERSSQTLASARVERAAYVLRSAGNNARFARWKVTMLAKARTHLQRAVVGIPIMVATVVVYAVHCAP